MKPSSWGMLLLLFCVGLLIFTAFRGLAFPDEGYILNTAQRMYDGQTLYRDFDFVYTPVTAFLTVLLFHVSGVSIFSERILALLLSLLTTYFLLRFSKKITDNQLLQLIPPLIYIAWGPSHINFIWPGMWAIDFAIIANSLLFESLEKKKALTAGISGVFFALVILTKQNYSVSVVLEIILLFLFLRGFRRKDIILPLSLGISFSLLVFLLYLQLSSSLVAFITNFYTNIIDQILVRGSINTPLPYGSNLLVTILKLLFYFSPFILSVYSLFIFWGKKKQYLPLLCMVILFFLLGFRPVSDYVHLSPLLSLNGIPFFLLIVHRKDIHMPLKHPRYSSPNKVIIRAFLRTLLYGVTLIMSVLGFWSALFFGYYRWSPPLVQQNIYMPSSRVGVWVDPQTKEKIETITTLLDTSTKPNEEIFLNYYAPMVYFLTNRKNPTRYDYTGLSSDAQKDVTKTLERKKIQTIVTFALNANNQSIIGMYIKKNYFLKKIDGEYFVWKRKT